MEEVKTKGTFIDVQFTPSCPRWYLLHWLIFHLLLTVFFFVISVIFFSVETSMRKLLGVLPVLASFCIIYCWSKVTTEKYLRQPSLGTNVILTSLAGRSLLIILCKMRPVAGVRAVRLHHPPHGAGAGQALPSSPALSAPPTLLHPPPHPPRGPRGQTGGGGGGQPGPRYRVLSSGPSQQRDDRQTLRPQQVSEVHVNTMVGETGEK